MASFLWPFLIYWLAMFVVCFIVVEIGHDQLYDEIAPHAGLKVAGGSFLIALMLAWLHWKGTAASYDSMFTSNIIWTVLQAIVWFAVFALIFEFHPWHALGLGVATMLLATGIATMGVESLLARSSQSAPVARATVSSQPVRQSTAPPAAPKADAAKPAQAPRSAQ